MLGIVKGKLIASCQALPDEPLHSAFIMGRMARAAKEGGAVAIRAQGVEDIAEIRKVTGLPVVGLIKKAYPDSKVFITATAVEVDALLATGCEMIALDATLRERPNGEKFEALVKRIHDGGALVMADIANDAEGLRAEEAGADCVSTTLSGYTDESPQLEDPDFGLMKRMAKRLAIPVIAEGRINTPEELRQAYSCGVYSAVVGSAISRPQLITARFVKAIQ